MPADGDRIEIRGVRVLARVGVPEAERASAQPLELDVDLELSLERAAASDDVADTVDYGVVTTAIAEAVEAGEWALLEKVAAVAADAALAVDARTEAALVTVRKLRPPVPRDVATAGVRVRRVRSR